MKNALIALSLTLVTVFAVGTPPPSHASDGLAGKELKPVSEAKRQVLGGVAEFLGRRIFGEEEEETAPLDSRETLDEFTRFLGGRLAEERAATGRIAKVLVLDEEDARLRLRVEHFDLDGCILRVRALDGDRRGQSAIVAQDVALAAGERETEIELELRSETGDGSAVTSSFLAVVAYDCAGDEDASRVFELGKTWSLPVAIADRVIAVTPRPIGAAAQLGASDTTLSLPPVVTQKRYATAVFVTPAARVSTGATAAPRHPGATVRDHRSGGTSGATRSPRSTVRDHRSDGTSGGSRSPGVTVRDHRGGGTSGGSRSSGVTVRDHRTGSAGGRTSDRYRGPARATGSFGQVVLGVDP
ncbi:MAG: hypothetical protein HKP30_05825, partial [Myxococcales bacterium]|nr:hypothetical protein [Myxococcales bacterium]